MFKGRRKWIFFALIVILITVMSLPMPWSRTIKRAAAETLSPLQRLAVSARDRVGGVTRVMSDRTKVIEENEGLKLENARLQRRVLDLEALEEENTRLARELDFARTAERNLVAARVVGRDITGWWRTIRLDRGSDDGLAIDQAVVTARGLVGKVVKVSASTSDVILISDPSCKVSVYLADLDEPGVLSGGPVSLRGSKVTCLLDLINKDAKVKKLQRVRTSGLGGVFPGGIDVGTVEAVELDDSALFQRAAVLPTVDLTGLSIVFVITDEAPVNSDAENAGDGRTTSLEMRP